VHSFLKNTLKITCCTQVTKDLQQARLGPGPGNQAQGAAVSSLGGGDVSKAGRGSEEAQKLQAGTE